MELAQFLSSLFEDGRVRVPPMEPLTDREVSGGDRELLAFEQRYRWELPGQPPAVCLRAAGWAAARLYRACQLAVYRDLGAEVIERELGEPYGEPPTAARHYSIDLTFRFLPDLLRFAASASEHDPLVSRLRQWCRDWPLSSVGVPDVGEVSVDGFADHLTLLRLYVDRILAQGDVARLTDLRVCEAAAAALGGLPELAPRIYQAVGDCANRRTTP